ncbi:MAG: elongation factor P [Candidatus Ryanbacteria bacterium CG10_big_fil_rev_8_21_14_0_10_43_42]|uniref:Elongation factor P n=1 Tax=Candidatus Ryanbacteria bacterium CG10_big_fil_rev_8_21_14_0_10_43_42 TaxID=1974864 RepID=A0A2M8KWX9_9BACT|nr:MAG: elongation factor P [Candidatus Ryanbacteria bacterium CG10_big_fil_rev_8_21_14_0_10_43_42]
MLDYNELKKGTLFEWNGEPYEVVEYNFMRMQQRRPVAQTKIRNLKTGSVSSQTFKQSDTFKELSIEKKSAIFVFCNKDTCTFYPSGKPGERFVIAIDALGDKIKYLKPQSEILARYINDKLLDIVLPIKVDIAVKEAPPAVKGNTAQGGVKQVTLETGAVINTPMFIEPGDIVRINTETGAYVERVT